MKKAYFTDSDTEETFEAYLPERATGNNWESPCFTREQAAKFYDSTPYDYRFFEANTELNPRDFPILIVYMEDGPEIIESGALPTDEGDILEGYFLPGEWMIATASLIASGYEWTCPACEHFNKEIEVKPAVTCKECGASFDVDDYHHAIG